MAVTLLVVSILVLVPAGCTRQSSAPPATDVSSTVGETATTKQTKAGLVSGGDPTRLKFEDRTAASGVHYEYGNGEAAGHFAILESLGGGLAAIDVDLDGYDDLCVAGGGSYGNDREVLPHATGLFRRRGDWAWTDVSEAASVANNRFYSHGISRTDFDLDGFPDFSVTGYGGVELYHNAGDGTFERIRESAGLMDASWSSSAAWGDLNGDALPDLYLAHYVDWTWDNDPFCNGGPNGTREICPPRRFTGITDALYFSNGDGTFHDATLEAALTKEGKGLGVVFADLDLDGDCDVYVTNDTVPNFLYENSGQGKLTDISLLSGASLSSFGVPDGSMGVDVCDYNNDGRPDIWVVNYERESNALYENTAPLVFRHVSQRVGINAVGGMYVGWGTCCQDFDLDGDEDMFVSNGHVIRYPSNTSLKQVPLLLENLESKRFRNVALESGAYFLESHMGRGACASDFDLDGDFDLAVSRTNQPVVVLSNESLRKPSAAWLSVRLIGVQSSREPVGAVVRLRQNSRTQTRWVKSGGSYSSSQSDRIIFGMDPSDGAAELEIKWPSGLSQVIREPMLGTSLCIVEPMAEQRRTAVPMRP